MSLPTLATLPTASVPFPPSLTLSLLLSRRAHLPCPPPQPSSRRPVLACGLPLVVLNLSWFVFNGRAHDAGDLGEPSPDIRCTVAVLQSRYDLYA